MSPVLRWTATVAAVSVAACQGKPPAPPAAPAPQPAAVADTAKPLAQPATPAAAPAAAIEPEPYALPAGQTLGDALPQLPASAPRLGSGGGAVGGAVLQAKTGCAADAPDDYTLVRRVEQTYPPAKPGEPAQVLEVCLLQKPVDRADKVAESGKAFLVVAAFADDSRVSHTFEQLARPPTALPPERQKAGHDGGSWAGLFATGDPDRPALAVVSGRFYDGALGEDVQFLRVARLLTKTAQGWQWSALAERSHKSVDLEHLRALCAGKADASPADRAAGALAAACDRVDAVETEAATADARMATRKKRLAGAGGGKPETDPDPQSIWLRDARAALAKGDPGAAIETALKVDVVCGEAVSETHAIVKEALGALKVEPLRAQPQQTLGELCEPLPDKPAPRRPRETTAKGKPEKGGDRAP